MNENSRVTILAKPPSQPGNTSAARQSNENTVYEEPPLAIASEEKKFDVIVASHEPSTKDCDNGTEATGKSANNKTAMCLVNELVRANHVCVCSNSNEFDRTWENNFCCCFSWNSNIWSSMSRERHTIKCLRFVWSWATRSTRQRARVLSRHNRRPPPMHWNLPSTSGQVDVNSVAHFHVKKISTDQVSSIDQENLFSTMINWYFCFCSRRECGHAHRPIEFNGNETGHFSQLQCALSAILSRTRGQSANGKWCQQISSAKQCRD